MIADPPDVVVATTGIGFRGWIEAADAAGLAEELLDVFAARGSSPAAPRRAAPSRRPACADWVAQSETAAEIEEFLLAEGVVGLRIAVQHHGSGADGLDEAFAEAGPTSSASSSTAGAPRTPRCSRPRCAHRRGQLDAVVFTSAPGVQAWLARHPPTTSTRSARQPRRAAAAGDRRPDHGGAAVAPGWCRSSRAAGGSARSCASS